MMQKAYFFVCGTIFFVVAGVHLARLFTGWDITIGSWVAPQWISVPGLIIPGLLSVWGFTLAARQSTPA